MRIDSHTHGNPSDLKAPKRYRARCEKAGINGIVLIRRPEDGLFDAAARLGDFVIPVPVVDIDRDGVEDIQRLFDRGAKGIKFIRPDHPYRDERYYPLYEAVKARAGVAVFHTGYLMHTPDYDPRLRAGMDDMRAAHIDTILRWVPHLKVLMAHFGNPYWDECWKVMISHPTVFADLSGGTAIYRSMIFWREMFAPNGVLSELSLKKLCFGSDLGYFHKDGLVDDHISQYIEFYERLFGQVGAPAALREKVNSGNVLALFGHR